MGDTICELCQRPATVHITTIEKGEKLDRHRCSKHASEAVLPEGPPLMQMPTCDFCAQPPVFISTEFTASTNGSANTMHTIQRCAAHHNPQLIAAQRDSVDQIAQSIRQLAAHGKPIKYIGLSFDTPNVGTATVLLQELLAFDGSEGSKLRDARSVEWCSPAPDETQLAEWLNRLRDAMGRHLCSLRCWHVGPR